MTWLRNLFAGEMANSAIRQFVIWPVGLFALCLFSSMTPRCQILLPSGLWWPLGDWLAVGVGTKKVHAFLNVRQIHTNTGHRESIINTYTLSGVWLLCQDLLLWWHYTDGFLELGYSSTGLQLYTIVKYKYTNSQKLESLIRSKGSLQPCVWLAVKVSTLKIQLWSCNRWVRWRYNCEDTIVEDPIVEDTFVEDTIEYVEDTIVKFLDIADVSQIGKQNTQQLIRRTKRVCKDSLSVTAGYGKGTDTVADIALIVTGKTNQTFEVINQDTIVLCCHCL